MMWGWGPTFGMGGSFMMFFGVIFWVLVIVGIVYAIRAFSGNTGSVSSQGSRSRALDILKERYARGEIDTEEYETRKREIVS